MNAVTQVMPVGSTVSRGTILKRLFVIGYLIAVAVAMIGWVSAFGWITVQVANWLLA
jgi:ABC-type enterochelin transport system permease subunit